MGKWFATFYDMWMGPLERKAFDRIRKKLGKSSGKGCWRSAQETVVAIEPEPAIIEATIQQQVESGWDLEERTMKRKQMKIMIGAMGLLAVMALVIGFIAWEKTRSTDQSPNQESPQSVLNWDVPSFQFTDQHGQPFGLSDLEGKVWVADMVLTECRDICPVLTSNMAQLQKRLAEEGVEAQLVTFSVDPETDTPDVLKQYGETFGADFDNWRFLTNQDFEKMKQFIESTFNVPVEHNHDPDATSPVMHSGRFFLVDSTGKVVKLYDGAEPNYDQIIQDIKELQSK
ncbi:SCO family protein [Desmospora profundinema]|uniref:Protein SCO1/2 n=1 Tax=Desmospora profundinema TaxID=1571184 RepID=A0ABU1IGY1_9BACL|nr:SCO family protein [Desmospora profundinema]MDR6224042.1 protein SCO1/2 [Desmospora profundinema]